MGYIGNQDYNIIEANIGTVTGTDTAANIVALPNDNGALWIASDTGHLFLNDGSQWHDVGQLQGDTGPQGVGVTGISKTSTSGLADTYTVTFSDMSTTTYTITNGKGIVGVSRTSGDGSEGTLDTYTIKYNDSTTSTYKVYNGADGNTWLTGSTAPLAGDGSDGDLYLNTATSFYYEKVAGAWVLKGTLKGDAYSYNAAGALAGRGAYDTEAAGFGYLSLDEAVPTVYFKLSSASGDWSIGTAVGKGAGISNVTKTGTLGNVDTYTITYDDLSTSTFTVTNANIDDSQITTTNTWSAEKIALALGDATSKPTFTTDAVTNIAGSSVTLNGTISDFGDASSSLQYRFIYGPTTAMEEGATTWTTASAIGAVSASVTVASTSTTYYALMQVRDTNKPDSMGLLPVPADWAAERTSFLSGSEVLDSDSYIYLQGTGGTGYIAMNSTNVPSLTNASIVSNEIVGSGAFKAISKPFDQDAGQGNFSSITPLTKIKANKLTVDITSTYSVPVFTSGYDNLLSTGSKIIVDDGGTIKEVTAGTVTKTGSSPTYKYTLASTTPTLTNNPSSAYVGGQQTYIYSADNFAGKTLTVDARTTHQTMTVKSGSTAAIPIFVGTTSGLITTGQHILVEDGTWKDVVAGTVTMVNPSAGVYEYTIAGTTPALNSTPTSAKATGKLVLTTGTAGVITSGDTVSLNSGTVGTNQNVVFGSVVENNNNTVSTVNIFGDNSCKALYQFEGNANDTSGTYNGTATNVTYGAGKFGQCAVFSGGSGNKIDLPLSVLSGTWQNFTLSYFVKRSTYTNTSEILQYIASSADFYVYFNNSGLFTFSIAGISPSSFQSTLDNWHHICVTRASSTVIIYIDSTLVASTTTFTDNANLRVIRFGSGAGSSTGDFNGSIDQVRIFNRAITASEVTTLYNEIETYYTCTSPTPSLVQIPTTAVKGSLVAPTLTGFTKATDTISYVYAKTALPANSRSLAVRVDGTIADAVTSLEGVIYV